MKTRSVQLILAFVLLVVGMGAAPLAPPKPNTRIYLPIIASDHVSTYYVDATNGDDSKPGTSQNQAWKTLSKVNTEFSAGTFGPGDRILFKRGETWAITKGGNNLKPVGSSGSLENYIYIGAYGTGNDPVFDLSGADGVYAIYHRSGSAAADYIMFENIEIDGTGSTDCAVMFAYRIHHWYLKSIYAHDFATGDSYALGFNFKESSHHVVFDNCTITDIQGEGIYISKAEDLTDRCQYFTIKNCYFEHCWAEAIDLKDGAMNCWIIDCTFKENGAGVVNPDNGLLCEGFQLSLGGSYNHVFRCQFKGTFQQNSAAIKTRYPGAESARFNVIDGCLFKNCTGKWGAIRLNGNDNLVVNCKMVNCRHAVFTTVGDHGGDNRVKNCTFRDCGTCAVYLGWGEASRIDFDYNRYDGSSKIWYYNGAYRDLSYVQNTLGHEINAQGKNAAFAETANCTPSSGSDCVNAVESPAMVYD